VTRPRHHPQSLESEQTPKLLERLADKCGVPVSSRPILDTVKARTPDHTLPLAARSNATRDDAITAVRAETEGRGVDVVLESAGSPAAFRITVEAVRPEGVPPERWN
jgi:NADPH:quinone reductase-like Zn-dependent oxidoreductase